MTATGAHHQAAWLAAPWLIVPPAVLFAASVLKAVYYLPYVIFCLPAVALLGGCGLAAVSWPARATAAALLAALITPTQLAIRVPDSGGALQPANQIIAAHERPGDAVIYPQGGIPPWYLAYPSGFGRLRDIGLRQPGSIAGRLYGTIEPLPVLLARECGLRRLWVIEIGPHWREPTAVLAPGFRLAHHWQPYDAAMQLWLYQRASLPGARCRT